MAFQYRQRTTAEWEKRATQQGGDFEGFIKDEYRMYQSKKADNFVRILPPTWPDPDHYGLDVWVHYSVGPDRATVICLQKMGQGACPVCEARAQAERGGDDELAKELKPSRRVVCWIVDRKEEANGPLVWAMPWTADRDICKISRDKRTGEVFVIDHPDEGYDVSFEKEGEGLTTKYTGWQLSRRASSVDERWLNFVDKHPIPDVLLWRDYEEINALFQGQPAPDKAELRREAAPRHDDETEPYQQEEPPPVDGEEYYESEPAEEAEPAEELPPEDEPPPEPQTRAPLTRREVTPPERRAPPPVARREAVPPAPVRREAAPVTRREAVPAAPVRREAVPSSTVRREAAPVAPRTTSPTGRAAELRDRFAKK